MRFTCRIIKTKTHTHTLKIVHAYFFQKWLIPPDLAKCFTPTQENRETNRWRIRCHYDLRHTVHHTHFMSKWTFLNFSAASGTLNEGLRSFIVVGAINLHKALSRHTQFFYMFDSDRYRTHCCVFSVTTIMRTRRYVTFSYIADLVLLHVTSRIICSYLTYLFCNSLELSHIPELIIELLTALE